MKVSVVIPAHNEEGCIESTVRVLVGTLNQAEIAHEVIVVNDHSMDATPGLVRMLEKDLPSVRYAENLGPGGYGFAVRWGLDRATGDAVAVYMADASDNPADLVRFVETMKRTGVDCVFGSRFTSQSKLIDYPALKRVFNRIGNKGVQLLFGLKCNDMTNAFKLFRREAIDGVRPYLSHHFNLTLELPLKAVVRGYSYTVIPNDWTNRKTGVSKWKVKELGSRYLFIVFYCLIEKWLSRGDYNRAMQKRLSALALQGST